MATKVFSFEGQGGGLEVDSNGFTLQDNEWSDCRNVRFGNRSVYKITGHESQLTVDSEIRFLQYWPAFGTNQYYVYIDGSGEARRVTAGNSEVIITQGQGDVDNPNQTFDVTKQITGGLINGGYALLLNDGESTPQYITSVGSGSNTTELTEVIY